VGLILTTSAFSQTLNLCEQRTLLKKKNKNIYIFFYMYVFKEGRFFFLNLFKKKYYIIASIEDS